MQQKSQKSNSFEQPNSFENLSISSGGLSREEDFLSSQQRLDAIADLVATIALRDMQQSPDFHPEPHSEQDHERQNVTP